ncbi:DinB family protein [Bacillus manliponensis]|uniref:DinB family protein n=1 Tax=Bacillus manliponensis TaxID=574376 RepID=UPI003518C1C3
MLKEKEEITTHHLETINWVYALRTLTEEQWRQPLQKGKWSTSEIIGHLICWDQFVLGKRIPYFFTNESMPSSPVAEIVNDEAAAKSRQSEQIAIITEFFETRRQLLDALYEIDDDLWVQDILIGTKRLTMYEYFLGLVKHDIHHFEQIRSIL